MQELSGRQLRVNFSKDSALADYAQQMGESVPQGGPADARAANGAMTVQEIVDSLAIHDVYDMVAQMKAFAESDQMSARKTLVDNPALTEAMIQMLTKLGMLKAEALAPPPQDPRQQQVRA